jgi:myo-inositol-1(or 4)-monophosphatase
LAAKPNLDPEHWHAAPPAVERALRPSLAYRLALVAQGKFDAMITLRPSWEWDIAAGDLILREAGAITSDRNGNPLIFNNKHPQVNGVIAAGKPLHTHLKTRPYCCQTGWGDPARKCLSNHAQLPDFPVAIWL